MGATELGRFLRARRERLRPEDVGLVAGARRRVAGLRREEVAMLASISPEYYLRLEQGRDHRPSREVLIALATALRLDADGIAYLDALARPTMPTRRPARDERPSTHVQSLIDGWPLTAAYLQGSRFTVLAANRLAAAISPHFQVGACPIRAAFLAGDMRTLYRTGTR